MVINPKIELLYRDLTQAFSHPFDWMGLLEKPPFWRWRWRRPHRKVAAIFESHGFKLTRTVAIGYHCIRPDDWMLYGLDAGGMICTKLERALCSQIPKDIPNG